MQPKLLQQGQHYFLFDCDRIPAVEAGHFQIPWWQQQQKLRGHAQGRGTVAFLDAGDNGWVLRHFRRGGLVAKIITDHYLWFGVEKTRAFREWRLLADLIARGLPVPQPIAAHVKRSGLSYQADLITAQIPNAETLATRLSRQRLAAAQWQALGGLIARFHGAGVYHHDLNAHNIMCSTDGDFWLIDFDKGSLRAPGNWQKSNYQRLKRSLLKLSAQDIEFHFTHTDWQAFLGGYLAGSGASCA